MNERDRQMRLAEDALRVIAYGRFEDPPGRRRTLIAHARTALAAIEHSRRVEREAAQLCGEDSAGTEVTT